MRHSLSISASRSAPNSLTRNEGGRVVQSTNHPAVQFSPKSSGAKRDHRNKSDHFLYNHDSDWDIDNPWRGNPKHISPSMFTQSVSTETEEEKDGDGDDDDVYNDESSDSESTKYVTYLDIFQSQQQSIRHQNRALVSRSVHLHDSESESDHIGQSLHERSSLVLRHNHIVPIMPRTTSRFAYDASEDEDISVNGDTRLLLPSFNSDFLPMALNLPSQIASNSSHGFPFNESIQRTNSESSETPQFWEAAHTRSHAPNVTTNRSTEYNPADNYPPLPGPTPDYIPLPPIAMANGDVLHPVHWSNVHPNVLGLENFGLFDFLHDWAARRYFGVVGGSTAPQIEELTRQRHLKCTEVNYEDLKGDKYDFQGLNWTVMGSTRAEARARRKYTYRNYVNLQDSDKWDAKDCSCKGRKNANFYRFKRANIHTDVCLAHFQLRGILGCPTRGYAFYPGPTGVRRFNTLSRTTDTFMVIPEFSIKHPSITTLDAEHDFLMCGTFEGDYYVKSLYSTDDGVDATGQVSSQITTHIKIESRRSSCPTAAIATNDGTLRFYDVNSDRFVRDIKYERALNCTALSSDRRLRALVGDNNSVLITDADSGDVRFALDGHNDYGFACAWSEDGHTFASGSQDRAVKIWDARYWQNANGAGTPLYTIKTELAGARSLRFSPVGSGPPVLIAAEEADFVNIIDAKSFTHKQTVDLFGEICGTAFTNDGDDLMVLCRDVNRGGFFQFERCGRGTRMFSDEYASRNEVADDDILEPF